MAGSGAALPAPTAQRGVRVTNARFAKAMQKRPSPAASVLVLARNWRVGLSLHALASPRAPLAVVKEAHQPNALTQSVRPRGSARAGRPHEPSWHSHACLPR